MAENTEPPRSVEDVKALLETTEKGGFRNSIRNCLTVFQCDPLLSGAVAYNLSLIHIYGKGQVRPPAG